MIYTMNGTYHARMVEQVDTVDLKSAAYKACGFKSLYEQYGKTNEI